MFQQKQILADDRLQQAKEHKALLEGVMTAQQQLQQQQQELSQRALQLQQSQASQPSKPDTMESTKATQKRKPQEVKQKPQKRRHRSSSSSSSMSSQSRSRKKRRPSKRQEDQLAVMGFQHPVLNQMANLAMIQRQNNDILRTMMPTGNIQYTSEPLQALLPAISQPQVMQTLSALAQIMRPAGPHPG